MTDVKSIHGHTELAEVPATADEVLVWDASAAAHRRVSRANFLGYTEYVALLTQSGTGAPTAVDVKNDTGATVTWARALAGTYTATFSSAVLTANKALVLPPRDNYLGLVTAYVASTAIVAMLTTNLSGTPLDGQLSNSPIIIRIYK